MTEDREIIVVGADEAVTEAVTLIARVLADGDRYLAIVDALELEGKGATVDAAQQSLVQIMRGWLERQDTSGKLGSALGVEGLDEETEIVLQFVDDSGAHREPSG